MRVLITGGLGVNGVWVLRQLISQGHDITLTDFRRDFSAAHDIEDAVPFRLLDVTDAAAVNTTIAEVQPECVAHLAAIMPDEVVVDPMRGFNINTVGTVNVLEACRVNEIPRVIFTSSRACFGAAAGVHATGSYVPMPETYYPVRPNAYGRTKLAAEDMVGCYREIYSMSVASLRFASIFGPGRDARHGVFSLLSGLIESAYRGEPVHVESGGDQCSDFIYVEDVARGVIAAMTAESLDYPIYNISSGFKTSLREFASAINEVAGKPYITVGPGLDYYHANKDLYGILDNTRARENFDFILAYPIRAGIERYMSHLKSQPA
jgi:UDP-glucose 4-epimerase